LHDSQTDKNLEVTFQTVVRLE